MPFPSSTRNSIPEPLLESESTMAQRDTEMECEPYFADLTQLAPDQIDHLRQTGLLPLEGLEIQLLVQKHADYLSQVWERPLGGKHMEHSKKVMMLGCQERTNSHNSTCQCSTLCKFGCESPMDPVLVFTRSGPVG
jgi:hypothetical protein